jgi:hypothetical protein
MDDGADDFPDDSSDDSFGQDLEKTAMEMRAAAERSNDPELKKQVNQLVQAMQVMESFGEVLLTSIHTLIHTLYYVISKKWE